MPEAWKRLRISVITAPKLETLGCLSHNTTLEIGTTVYQGMRFNSLTTVVRSMKVLALRIDYLSLDTVIDFMRCFPCLEKLYIETFNPGCKNIWRRKKMDPIECLDFHLKKLVLLDYRSNKPDVNFTKFFLLNGKVLELIRLECGNMQDNSK